MKQLKPTAVRKTMLLLVAIIITVIMTATLVACGDKDNDDDQPFDGEISISLDTINSAQFNQAINGMIGYIHANIQENYTVFIQSYIDILSDKDEEEQAYLELNIENYRDDIDDYETIANCYILFYKSDEFATVGFEEVKNDYSYDSITKNGSVIIIESKEGLYNEIINSPIPQDSTSRDKIKFINDVLKKELTATDPIQIMLWDDLGQGGVVTYPKKGNISKPYGFFNSIENSNIDLSKYTDDSYITEKNGIYYTFLQHKSGFIFEENQDGTGYVISNYFYHDAPKNLTISSTYNNKPIVGIDRYVIPYETTQITYQGTKAQWESMNIDLLSEIEIIHCLDGDITITND